MRFVDEAMAGTHHASRFRRPAGEESRSEELRTIAERHATEHDVYHVGHALSERCDRLASGLVPFLQAYGQRVREDDGADGLRAFAERVRRTTAALAGRSEKTGLLLLRDLRELFVLAQEAEIDWTIARQGALAARDPDLALTCMTGILETERVTKWLKTRIKESAPQVLAR
jgi:hypothetical protein